MTNAITWVINFIASAVTYFSSSVTIMGVGLIPFLVAIAITGLIIGRLF